MISKDKVKKGEWMFTMARLLHDNARSYTTRLRVEGFGWVVSTRPPHNPNSAPSDYRLFAEVKKVLRGNTVKTTTK